MKRVHNFSTTYLFFSIICLSFRPVFYNFHLFYLFYGLMAFSIFLFCISMAFNLISENFLSNLRLKFSGIMLLLCFICLTFLSLTLEAFNTSDFVDLYPWAAAICGLGFGILFSFNRSSKSERKRIKAFDQIQIIFETLVDDRLGRGNV